MNVETSQRSEIQVFSINCVKIKITYLQEEHTEK